MALELRRKTIPGCGVRVQHPPGPRVVRAQAILRPQLGRPAGLLEYCVLRLDDDGAVDQRPSAQTTAHGDAHVPLAIQTEDPMGVALQFLVEIRRRTVEHPEPRKSVWERPRYPLESALEQPDLHAATSAGREAGGAHGP